MGYPKTPSIQIVPTLGLKSIHGTYFGLFGVLGFGFRIQRTCDLTLRVHVPIADSYRNCLLLLYIIIILYSNVVRFQGIVNSIEIVVHDGSSKWRLPTRVPKLSTLNPIGSQAIF